MRSSAASVIACRVADRTLGLERSNVIKSCFDGAQTRGWNQESRIVVTATESNVCGNDEHVVRALVPRPDRDLWISLEQGNSQSDSGRVVSLGEVTLAVTSHTTVRNEPHTCCSENF